MKELHSWIYGAHNIQRLLLHSNLNRPSGKVENYIRNKSCLGEVT